MPGPKPITGQTLTTAQRQAEFRKRRKHRDDLTAQLLHAVRNARLDDAELHQCAQHGDDLKLLANLITYYQKRHWMHSAEIPTSQKFGDIEEE